MPPGDCWGGGGPGRKLRGMRLVRFVLQEGPWGSGEGLDPCGVQRWGWGKLTVCGQGAGALVRAGAQCLGGWARAVCPGLWVPGVEEGAREAGWVFGAEGEGGLSNEAAVLASGPVVGLRGGTCRKQGKGRGEDQGGWVLCSRGSRDRCDAAFQEGDMVGAERVRMEGYGGWGQGVQGRGARGWPSVPTAHPGKGSAVLCAGPGPAGLFLPPDLCSGHREELLRGGAGQRAKGTVSQAAGTVGRRVEGPLRWGQGAGDLQFIS